VTEKIPNAGRPDPDEHLHEIGSFKQIIPEQKEKHYRDDPREHGGKPLIGSLAFELYANFL
jgi:hypothetical protein